MLASQIWVQRGWHRSFAELMALAGWRAQPGRPPTDVERGVRTIFLFIAAYAFAFWVFQAQTYLALSLDWRGLGLALLAPLYIAAGLTARRWRTEYTWPLYTAGYALTAVGAMLAFEDEALFIYVLVLNAVVYAVSALIFSQPFWLYLTTVLAPVIGLLILNRIGRLEPVWAAPLLMALAFIYFGVGRLIERRRPTAGGLAPFALPFLAPAYLLSAVALAAASGERGLALAIYLSGVVFYALSAWAYRETLFLYPAVWLSAVPYFLVVTRLPLEARWQGLAWLPLIALSLALGRGVFHRRRLAAEGFARALLHPAMPFYLLAYALSLSVLVLFQRDALALTLAALAVSALYFFSGVLFRRPAWFFPALLAAHLALLAGLAIKASGGALYQISVPFHALTWLIALTGYALYRLTPGAAPADPAPAVVQAAAPVSPKARWLAQFRSGSAEERKAALAHLEVLGEVELF